MQDYNNFCEIKASYTDNETDRQKDDIKLYDIHQNTNNETNRTRIKKQFRKKIKAKIHLKNNIKKRKKKKMKMKKKDDEVKKIEFLDIYEDNFCYNPEGTISQNIEIIIEKTQSNKMKPEINRIISSKKDKKIKAKSKEILYPEQRKFYGNWLKNPKYEVNIIDNKNSFINKYPEILEHLSFFGNNPPKFLSHLVIRIKNKVSCYGQKIINKCINIEDESLRLYKLDYESFIKDLSKKFNDINLCKKLEDIFIEYQAENEGNLKDHNKKIIKYIRSQGSKELFANEYLDLSFYELFGDFKENYLPKYLDEIEALFPKDIEKEKIDAYKNIIKIICENYQDYFDLIDERKKL